MREKIEQFIEDSFLVEFGEEIDEETDLFKAGVLDSYGYIKLLKFLETEFQIKFSELEILSNVMVDFKSILSCVEEKKRLL